MTKPVPPYSLAGKPYGHDGDGERTEEILQRLRQAANDRHAGMADDETAQALENVLFPASRERKKSRFPVLIAVFMVSAVAGGAVAGLYLAGRDAPPPVLQAGAPGTAGIVIEKEVPVRDAEGASVAASKTDGNAVSGEEARLVAETRPAPAAETTLTKTGEDGSGMAPVPAEKAGGNASDAPVRTRAEEAEAASAPQPPEMNSDPSPAPATPPAPDMADDTGRVVRDLERQLPAAGAVQEGAGTQTPATANEVPENGTPGSPDELKALTDNVIQALGALIPGSGGTAETANTSDLRSALTALVDKAMDEGHSKNEIVAILDKAIEEAGAENIPEELLGPDGKVDLNLLIASVIPKDMEMVTEADSSYVKELIAEGRRTSLKGQKKAAADTRSRFYMRDKRRYTRIRRGDTLTQIAFDAYGDALAYPRILRANAGRISVRNLRPGMEIRVPGPNESLAAPAAKTAAPARTTRAGRRAAAARKRATRTRKAATRTTKRRTARRRADAARQRQQAPKITDRLLGVIGAGSATQSSTGQAAAGQAKPADEPTVTTNFQRYKINSGTGN